MGDCDNTCMHNLFLCQDNPMLPAIFGPRMVAYLPGLQAMCVPPVEANGGGDGVCNLNSLQRCVAGGRRLDAECGTGPQDPQCTCGTDCVQEYIDCIDSPVLASSRPDIVLTQQLCASDLSNPGGPKYAGDGACDLFSAHDLCNRDTLNAVGADGRLLGGVQMCSDPCYQEMIDCVDSP